MRIAFFLKESLNYLVFSYTKPFVIRSIIFLYCFFDGRSLLQPRACCLFIDFKSTASKRGGRGSGFPSLIAAQSKVEYHDSKKCLLWYLFTPLSRIWASRGWMQWFVYSAIVARAAWIMLDRARASQALPSPNVGYIFPRRISIKPIESGCNLTVWTFVAVYSLIFVISSESISQTLHYVMINGSSNA